MDSEKKNTIGFWIVVIVFMVALISKEQSFISKTNKRFDNIWAEWTKARAKIEEMLELNDKTLNELDVDGELEYWCYDDIAYELDSFEHRLEHETLEQG